jgi:hypothetical protein
VNGQAEGPAVTFNAADYTQYTFENVPPNALVKVTLTMVDSVGLSKKDEKSGYTPPDPVGIKQTAIDTSKSNPVLLYLDKKDCSKITISRYVTGSATPEYTEDLDPSTLEQSYYNKELCYQWMEPKVSANHAAYTYKIITYGTAEVTPRLFAESTYNLSVMNHKPEVLNCKSDIDITEKSFTLTVDSRDSDNDSLTYIYELSGHGSAPDSSQCHTWSGLAIGTYNWKVTVKDGYDETYSQGTVEITAGSAVTGFKINKGLSCTNDPVVTITDIATTGPCQRISLSNNPDGPWKIYDVLSVPITWTLSSEDGKKTVYIQAEIDEGEFGGRHSEDIILDTKTPFAPSGLSQTSEENGVTFAWLPGEDNGSGVEGTEVELWQDGAWVSKGNVTDSKLYIAEAGFNKQVRLRIRTVDKAGLKSDWVETDGYTKAQPSAFNPAKTERKYDAQKGYYFDIYVIKAEGANRYELR